MFAYCLFCRTQRCHVIADLLEKKGADRAFSPQIISRQRKQGKLEEVRHDLLPGYVFVFTEEEQKTFDLFRGIDGIIRCLRNDDGTMNLTRADYRFAMELRDKDGLIGALTVLKEGEKVRIKDSVLENYGGTIESIDHRKQRAKVRFRFDNQERTAWVACDVLYKEEGAGKQTLPEN